MLITTEVEVKWGNNRKIYEPLGYKFTKAGDLFNVKIEHLAKSSHIVVNVICDYCGKSFTKRFDKYNRHLNESPIKKDTCTKCKSKKAEESNIKTYGKKVQWVKYDDVESIRNEFIEYNLTPLFNEFKSSNHHLEFICNKHPEYGVQKSTYIHFKHRNQGCKYCGYERASGELHHNYNPNLTEEDRKRNRNIMSEDISVFQLSDAVIKRDNFTCSICGDSNADEKLLRDKKKGFVIHHLNGYHWFEKGRFDVNNCVTLCKKCHLEFHKIYGTKYNTVEQFEEFIFLKMISKC